MRVALVGIAGYEYDECCVGANRYRVLSSQPVLACSYLREQGIDAVFVDRQLNHDPLSNYDVAVVWVPLFDGYTRGMAQLREAKDAGLTTIMVLNDPVEGCEEESLREHPYVDYAISHWEREVSLGILLKRLDRRNADSLPPNTGIWRGVKHGLGFTGKHPPLATLDHLASTRSILDELAIEKYDKVRLTMGRGCPMRCSFCLYRGTIARKRHVDVLLDELRCLAGRTKVVELLDLDISLCPDVMDELCDALTSSGLRINWESDCRADRCTPERVRRLRQAGCRELLIGVETFNDAALQYLEKPISEDDILRATAACVEHGVDVYFSFMIGFPWDSHESLTRTYQFLTENISATVNYGVVYVIPERGTPLFDVYVSEGLVAEDLTCRDYEHAKKHPLARTRHLSREELVSYWRVFRRSKLGVRRLVRGVRRHRINSSLLKEGCRKIRETYF